MFISQCSSNALIETRRVLDQFAERKGTRTWQTGITEQGLTMVRKLLKKSARRNTAVACHWIKSGGNTELLWIVGKLNAFNVQGSVPTNATNQDILRSKDENSWHTVEDIALITAIAGLFHDFGKANDLFQKKLLPDSGITKEPFRHEWVSIRLFQAFVSGLSDSEWLLRLAQVSPADEALVLSKLIQDGPSHSPNPFASLPKLAQVVSWLILSHHRLPQWSKKSKSPEPRIRGIDTWLTGPRFHPSWNSPQCGNEEWTEADFKNVWKFSGSTPVKSLTWCKKAQSVGKRAIKRPDLIKKDWLEDRFSSHIARLCLMLSDHCYSAGPSFREWQDSSYRPLANTDRKTRLPHQKLDEHNVGVGHNGLILARILPNIRAELPSISRHRALKKRSTIRRFLWQNKAFDLARSVSERSRDQGFFGINMASTGCGKTWANARVMYGLSDERLGCRFSVALGLRTLTLQTGDALRAKLQLEDDDIAVLVGSEAVRDLHELSRQHIVTENLSLEVSPELTGSESAADLIDELQLLRYEGAMDDNRLGRFLRSSPKILGLISAPVLVSTIDHLMPATEGDRGGRQIGPMLRLLTSDLVLDEPDDFDLSDLPGLCRLVNWAGMLGARVLLSSATLPPSIVQGLFAAYLNGRKAYHSVRGQPSQKFDICCAWFDEFSTLQQDLSALDTFSQFHEEFVRQRSKLLEGTLSPRMAEIICVSPVSESTEDVQVALADSIRDSVYRLHSAHRERNTYGDKSISVGLVRFANIDPLVAVSQLFLSQDAKEDHKIHFCIYHSRHPLAVRSSMELELDRTLTRHDRREIWKNPTVAQCLKSFPEKNHVFIVFATSVAEVGRDHDYDWAIVEPSSMRSLVQLSGRIQRHRLRLPEEPNLLILNKNYRALKGESIAYQKPGFESEDFKLVDKDLAKALRNDQYERINAVARIMPNNPLHPSENFVDLEHAHLKEKIFGSSDERKIIPASIWWEHQATWSAEIQRKTKFRASQREDSFILYSSEFDDDLIFAKVSEGGGIVPMETFFERVSFVNGCGVHPWVENVADTQLEEIAEQLSISADEVCKKFGVFSLPMYEDHLERWRYHPWFGLYRKTK